MLASRRILHGHSIKQSKVKSYNILYLEKDIFDFFQSNSASDLLLEEEIKSLSAEILKSRNILPPHFSDRVVARIEELVAFSYEDNPERTPLTPLSLHAFATFLSNNAALKRPSIVLTPSRNIQAQWGKRSDQKLVAEFLTSNEVSFVLFSQDEKRKGRINRVSGKVTNELFLTAVAPLGAFTWIYDTTNGQ